MLQGFEWLKAKHRDKIRVNSKSISELLYDLQQEYIIEFIDFSQPMYQKLEDRTRMNVFHTQMNSILGYSMEDFFLIGVVITGTKSAALVPETPVGDNPWVVFEVLTDLFYSNAPALRLSLALKRGISHFDIEHDTYSLYLLTLEEQEASHGES